MRTKMGDSSCTARVPILAEGRPFNFGMSVKF
jgi:hypothetical protein